MQKVTVSILGGSQIEADHVIFTPSLGVLKANHSTLFTPGLPAQKQLAIEVSYSNLHQIPQIFLFVLFCHSQNLGFGSISKVNLEFSEPWWPLDFEGLFPIWDDIDYSNASLQYWRTDITEAELLAEYDGIPLWARAMWVFIL